MSNTATHAYRPTADCIWNSFRSSAKRHLLLTGSRGSGKTTLLARLFPHPLPGITTWAEPGRGVYLRENGGASRQVGVFDPALPGTQNRMRPLCGGFDEWGAEALLRCAEAESPWISIDEIGYLEAQSAAYRAALLALMEKKQLAAVLRSQDLPFLREIRCREDAFLVDLDAPFGKPGCVIMASGLGRRFGGNKLMADFRGQPLICSILNATEGVFARRIVVTRHADVARLCRARGAEVLVHDLPHRSDTIRLGLEALGDVQGCMFCPADQPLLRRESIAALALAGVNAPDAIWRASFEGVPGAPVLFPKGMLAELRNLPRGQGGAALMEKYPGSLRCLSVRHGYELMDADRPEELERLRTIK